MGSVRTAGLLTLAVLLGVGHVFAQGDDTVQLGAHLVEIRAVVTDAKGKPVGGLTKDDFEVADAGMPQDLAFFSVERIAGPRGAATGQPAPPASPDAAPDPARPAARTVVLFVDDFHLSPVSLLRVKKALARFATDELSDSDLLGLVTASGSMRMFGRFGSDRSVLLAAVAGIPPGPTAGRRALLSGFLANAVLNEFPNALAYAAEYLFQKDHGGRRPSSSEADQAELEDYRRSAKSTARESLADEVRFRMASLDTLKNLCDGLASLPGQRLVLVYTDGYSVRDRDGTPTDDDLRRAASRAVLSGVVVNAIIATGLSVEAGVSADSNVAPNPELGGIEFMMARANMRDLENGPAALARQTGGVLIRDRNDLESLGREVLANNAEYYAMSYYSPEPSGEKFRKLAVRVKGHPDYEVRAQNGYVPVEGPVARGPAIDPKRRLLDSLVLPTPATDLSVSLVGPELARDARTSRMLLRTKLDAAGLDLRESPRGTYSYSVDATTVVFDVRGKLVTVASDNVRGELSKADAQALLARGLGYTASLDPLSSGIYQVRVAFQDRATRRIGSASMWVKVP